MCLSTSWTPWPMGPTRRAYVSIALSPFDRTPQALCLLVPPIDLPRNTWRKSRESLPPPPAVFAAPEPCTTPLEPALSLPPAIRRSLLVCSRLLDQQENAIDPFPVMSYPPASSTGRRLANPSAAATGRGDSSPGNSADLRASLHLECVPPAHLCGPLGFASARTRKRPRHLWFDHPSAR